MIYTNRCLINRVRYSSLQYVVQDTYSGCGLRKGERIKPEARTALRSMQVFDYLIGNPDRNSDNFLA